MEMDIRFTKEGIPVICHDDNTSKLFGSTREIAELTIGEFLALRYSQDPQAKANADVIRLWEAWVTQEEIDRFHQMGKRVWVMAGAPKDGSVGFTDKENLAHW